MALACKAAAGNKTTESCASAVTRAVFALGKQSIVLSGTAVDIGYTGAAVFVEGNGVYLLSDFIDTAKLKPDSPVAMNCADLAGAVAILSSAIGCRQVAARLEPKSGAAFQTNPIELFGATSVRKEDVRVSRVRSNADARRRSRQPGLGRLLSNRHGLQADVRRRISWISRPTSRSSRR